MPYLRAKAGMARMWSAGGGMATADRAAARTMAQHRKSQTPDATHAIPLFSTNPGFHTYIPPPLRCDRYHQGRTPDRQHIRGCLWQEGALTRWAVHAANRAPSAIREIENSRVEKHPPLQRYVMVYPDAPNGQDCTPAINELQHFCQYFVNSMPRRSLQPAEGSVHRLSQELKRKSPVVGLQYARNKLVAALTLSILWLFSGFTCLHAAKDQAPSNPGFVTEFAASTGDVLQALEEVLHDQIIHGTQVFDREPTLTGAIVVQSTPLFPSWKGLDKVFY